MMEFHHVEVILRDGGKGRFTLAESEVEEALELALQIYSDRVVPTH